MSKGVKVHEFPGATANTRAAFISGPAVTVVDTNTSQTLYLKTIAANCTVSGATITGATQTINVATLAGTGASTGDSAAIVTAYPAMILATGGNNSVGIKLPVAVAGAVYTIKNDDAANGIMKVYPQVNSTINTAANSAFSMAANTMASFIAFNATTWVTNKVPC